MVDQRDNRREILARAVALFADSGYDAVGVQQICDAAGVTKPTLYHYFGSKAGLLDALLADRYAPFLRDLAAATTADRDLNGRLKLTVAACFGFAAREPETWRLQVAALAGAPANPATVLMRRTADRQGDLIHTMFTDASARNGNLRGRERIHAAMLLGAINAWITLWLDGHATLDDGAVTRVVQLFSYGIYS